MDAFFVSYKNTLRLANPFHWSRLHAQAAVANEERDFLKKVITSTKSNITNQTNDHSGICRPKIAGSFAEQSPSALNNQGITLASW